MRACQNETATVPPFPAPPSSDLASRGHLLPSSREKDARRRRTIIRNSRRSRRAILLPIAGEGGPFVRKGRMRACRKEAPTVPPFRQRPHPTRLRRATFSRRAGRRTRGVVGPAAGWTGALAVRSFSRTAGEGGPFVRKGRMRACQDEAPTVPPLPCTTLIRPRLRRGHPGSSPGQALLPSSREKERVVVGPVAGWSALVTAPMMLSATVFKHADAGVLDAASTFNG